MTFQCPFQTTASPQTFGSLLAVPFPEGFIVVCRESCACMVWIGLYVLSELLDAGKRGPLAYVDCKSACLLL